MNQEQSDNLLSQLLQSSGSHPKFLDTVFSFLQRRTDFYVVDDVENFKNGTARMGFPPGRAAEMVKDSMGKQQYKHVGKGASGGGGKATKQSKKTATKTGAATTPTTTTSNVKQEQQRQKAPPKPPQQDPFPKPGTNISPTPGNGLITPNYYWTQSLNDLTIYFPSIPTSVKGKNCKVITKAGSLSVVVDGEKLIEGEFERKVNVSESIWSLESGCDTNTLQIHLEKVQKTWWVSPVTNDEYKIDCSKVDSTMHVSEYDEATQGKIREIMFQQQEERRKIASGEMEAPMPPIMEPNMD